MGNDVLLHGAVCMMHVCSNDAVAASDNDVSSGSLQNTDQVTSHHPSKQLPVNESAPNFNQDTPNSKESSVEPSKRRSVVFSPDTKELDNDGPNSQPSNRQSLNTSQTIKDAKEILKKANSGHSFSSVLTSESDRSDNDVLSSSGSSSADVDMLESRVSQLESGLITEHPKPESKGDQSSSKLSDDHSSSKSSDSTTTSSHSSDQGSGKSGSQSEVDHMHGSIPSDHKLLDDQSSSQQIVNASHGDHQSTSQLSQANQSSSHSLDASKPLDGDQSTTEADQNVTQHNQLPIQSPKDDQSTTNLSNDQMNNQHDQNTSPSDQDTDQTSNQQSQNNDQVSEQDSSQHDKHLSDQPGNQQDPETNLSNQGTDQHNQEKSDQLETADPIATEQDHNAS